MANLPENGRCLFDSGIDSVASLHNNVVEWLQNGWLCDQRVGTIAEEGAEHNSGKHVTEEVHAEHDS